MYLRVIILMFSVINIAPLQRRTNKRCGIDYSPINIVYEGFARVETYPWLGRLYYPVDEEKLTTIVVLITRELVIGPAFDIDKYPKDDFRAKSRVVLGGNCSGPKIGVRDYTYHPDYKEQTLSGLAIIQLQILDLKIDLHPICTPPTKIHNADFYAMTLARDCNKSEMRIFKMAYVDPEECKMFYRKSGLDIDHMWPTHTACAKALSGGKCVWRNGAVLVLREDGRWRLAGIGVYGPGCETPARFLDYGMYHAWVRASISNIGKPAVTRMGPDHLILRRSLSSMQRFGDCDKEETKAEIFTDQTIIENNPPTIGKMGTAIYNLTLFANVDYSCIILKVSELGEATKPGISLRRWCSTTMPACYEFQNLQVDFFVKISFRHAVDYKVLAYGREVRLIDRKAFTAYMNQKRQYPTSYWNVYYYIWNLHEIGSSLTQHIQVVINCNNALNCVSPYVSRNLTCGVDKSNASMVYEGRAAVATYPWMGTFYYPLGKKKVTTAVVLITKQIVLGSANEIDMLPKHDLRQRSWVTLGRSCDAPGIKIRDYSFHPDFRRDTYSALALIQLEVDLALQELIPICGPPTYFIDPQIYAMTPSNNCKKGIVHIYKMKYVNKAQCKQFYRKSGLDADMFWPTYATCARALSGGRCRWRSGAALVVKQDGRWRLLGFGVNGPGCQAPARFLDYGMHQLWARNSVARIGSPAITRLDSNHIVMRRSMGNLQRYGPCDEEETKYEMYTDRVKLVSNKAYGTATYNLTLVHGVEYSCVVLRVDAIENSEENDPCEDYIKPKIHLRRWCAGPQQMCHSFQFLEIQFFMDIEFSYSAYFHFAAYGKEAIIILPTKSMAYANSEVSHPGVYHYKRVQYKLWIEQAMEDGEGPLHLWFYEKYQNSTWQPRDEPKFIDYYIKKYKTNRTLLGLE